MKLTLRYVMFGVRELDEVSSKGAMTHIYIECGRHCRMEDRQKEMENFDYHKECGLQYILLLLSSITFIDLTLPINSFGNCFHSYRII